MTQKDLVIRYLQERGNIIPAKIAGLIYLGHMFGSETSKRCRELRKQGVLQSYNDGKFEVFKLAKPVMYQTFKVEGMDKIIKLQVK